MDADDQPLAGLLVRAGQTVARCRDRAAAEHGLTTTAMGVLGALAHEGGVSHRELAARLGVSPATLTPVVEALATSGDLRRERDPADRRVVRLSVTGPGRARHATAAVAVEAAVRERTPEPPAAAATAVRAYLRAVLEGR